MTPSPENRPLRVLAIGHCYIDTLPRQKWYALRDLAPECDIRVITPLSWPHELGTLRSSPVATDRLAFLPMRTVGTGYGSRYVYASWDLVRVLRDHDPHIIHIDHEPWAMVCAQVAVLARWCAPRARAVSFSWWNTPRQIPFPWSVIHRSVLSQTALLLVGNQDALGVHRALGYQGPMMVMPQLGVDIERFHPGPADGQRRATIPASARVVIGFVGRLLPEKGVDILIEALAGIRELSWHLLVVGAGPAARALTDLVAERGLADRVSFVGAVLQEEVPEWIRRMDVLVLPSTCEWHEQFGHVLVEAMACERAVVGSDSGEIPNTIGDAGLVFPCGDHRQLGKYLAMLIRNPDALRDYAKRGRERVLEKYSDVALAHQLRAVYHDLLVTGSSGVPSEVMADAR